MTFKVHSHALVHSAQWVIASITALTIIGELLAPLKDFLKLLTGHHWVTKGILGVLLFIVLYSFLSRSTDHIDIHEASKELWRTSAITVACCIALVLFFAIHFFISE